jgi:uncharacterized protein
MDLTWIHVVILVCSGLVVGFINTLAGGGTIISLSVFMFFGLPPVMANGTNRIAVLLQNITAVANFSKKKMIDWNKALRLAVPITLGGVAGAFFANIISNVFFNYFFGFVIVLVGITLIFNPKRWLNEKENLVRKALKWWHYLLFFFIGIYGGFIHVGIGYLIMGSLVLGTGNELTKANAIKNFLVLSYIPLSLVIFAVQGNVNWEYGLIHGIGNIAGAQIASSIKFKHSGNLIRYIMIALIIVVILQLFQVINPQILSDWLKNIG